MLRLLFLLLSLPMVALPAQGPRFRFSLRDDPDLPAGVRQALDSLHALSDSVNRCPSRADTLWAADPHASIPAEWLEASLRLGCRFPDLPNAVRRRLRDDSASRGVYGRVG
jgi:hypothetical protein